MGRYCIFHTELTAFSFTQFEDVQPTLLPLREAGAMTAAKEEDLSAISVRYFCKF